jgi:multidrug efflux pump subunit AcrB
VVGEKDLPLAPRIVGVPSIGKTTLAMVGGMVSATLLTLIVIPAIYE